jgi:hypothetical protein
VVSTSGMPWVSERHSPLFVAGYVLMAAWLTELSFTL